MEHKLERRGDVSVLTLYVPSLVSTNVSDFKAMVLPILEEHPQLVLDMSQIEFIDSSGLGALLSCLRKLKEKNGNLNLSCMTQQVRQICSLLRLNRVFTFFPTIEEACKAFEKE